ncbi:hypothetical protein LFL96_36915 (plasmid) [Paraburkholderia sp. D15]|nr:hypothetical protein [Paraburkholderia sp. D15]WGS55061.1 hypothetical protein LFL96_36915 [Paraburkholderia sp. D15]
MYNEFVNTFIDAQTAARDTLSNLDGLGAALASQVRGADTPAGDI